MMPYRPKDEGRFPPWELVGTREVFSAPPWVRVYADTVRLPSGRIIDDFYRVRMPDYVVVHATRADGGILFERQYRHAPRAFMLDLPAGFCEPAEAPLDAAKRELLEETGYAARDWRALSSFWVDGNKECGTVHFFSAASLERVAEPKADETEVAEVVFLDAGAAMHALMDGEVPSLSTAALLALAAHPQFGAHSR